MGKDNRPYKLRAPKDLKDYVLQYCARRRYLIFSRKTGRISCTGCGEEWNLEDSPWLAYHDADGSRLEFCPRCSQRAITKDARYGRKKLTDQGRITWTRKRKETTYIETDRFVIDYTGMKPEVYLKADQQIKLSKKKQERFDFYDGWWSPKDGEWEKFERIGYKPKPSTMWGMSDRHDHLYYPVVTGTDLQYAEDALRFDNGHFDESWMIQKYIVYISDFLKYPAIEILDKSGFSKLVEERAEGYKSGAINIRGKDLRKILRCNGGEVKKLREIGIGIEFMERMRGVRKMAPWAKVEDILDLDAILGRFMQISQMELIKARTDLSKLLRKILDYNRSKAAVRCFTLRDYGDYLEAVIKMGWRTDKKTLYPKDFIGAHDAALEEAAKIQDEIDRRIFQENQFLITKMTDPFYSAGLMIRPASTQQELRDESEHLHHCVRTYADKICRGACAILFVRQAEEPDTPYFTLELSPQGKIVQCRGEHNCSYPEEVRIFIEEWMAWRKKMIKEADAA